MFGQHLFGDDIHIWYTDPKLITDPYLLDQYYDILSPLERKRYWRFCFDRDRKVYLVTRALVRSALSKYVDLEPGELRFIENKYGRPFVEPQQLSKEIFFSISHTIGLIVCAITRNSRVGIDAEFIYNRSFTMDMVNKYYSADEIKQIGSLSKNDRAVRIVELWTLKEAYLKARSRGLFLPIESVSFNLDEQGKIYAFFGAGLENDCPKSWSFRQFKLTPVHVFAIAASLKISRNLEYSMYHTVPFVEYALIQL